MTLVLETGKFNFSMSLPCRSLLAVSGNGSEERGYAHMPHHQGSKPKGRFPDKENPDPGVG